MKKYIHGNTMVLSHFYCSPEVQQLADFIGDSLQLAQISAKEKPNRVVFASVKFMAEQTKILSPSSTVILPQHEATCSLVEMTDIVKLTEWKNSFPNSVLVSYVNSSVEQKSISDIIATSANVVEIISYLTKIGKKVLFANDRNMGAYLNWQFNLNVEVWQDAVCIVHDNFKDDELELEMAKWTNGSKFLISHPESILPVLKRSDFIGSTTQLLNWIKHHPYKISTIWVATEPNILYNMKKLRPELDIRIAPSYQGCACDRCPWMAMNTTKTVQQAIDGIAGLEIQISDDLIQRAKIPIDRMMEFQRTGKIEL